MGSSEELLTRRDIGRAQHLVRKATRLGGRERRRRWGWGAVPDGFGSSYRESRCSSNGLRVQSSRTERSHDDIGPAAVARTDWIIALGRVQPPAPPSPPSHSHPEPSAPPASPSWTPRNVQAWWGNRRSAARLFLEVILRGKQSECW